MDEQEFLDGHEMQATTFRINADTFTAYAHPNIENVVYEDGEEVREMPTESLFPIIVFSDGSFSQDDEVVETMNDLIAEYAKEMESMLKNTHDPHELLEYTEANPLIETTM